MNKITRQAAIAMGLKFYFTGKECKHGHISERYVAGGCKDCVLANSKGYYQSNKKVILKEMKKGYYDNREEILEKQKQEYKSNPGKYKQRHRVWMDNNKESVNHHSKLYRARHPEQAAQYAYTRRGYLKDAQPLWYERDLVKEIYDKRNILNKLWGTNFQVDHIIPIVNDYVCGLHCWANLQLLDASINGVKNNNNQTDW